MPGYSAADRLALLEVHYCVSVTLTANGRRLDVSGPRAAVDAAVPTLRQHRAALLAHLKQIARGQRRTDSATTKPRAAPRACVADRPDALAESLADRRSA